MRRHKLCTVINKTAQRICALTMDVGIHGLDAIMIHCCNSAYVFLWAMYNWMGTLGLVAHRTMSHKCVAQHPWHVLPLDGTVQLRESNHVTIEASAQQFGQ